MVGFYYFFPQAHGTKITFFGFCRFYLVVLNNESDKDA